MTNIIHEEEMRAYTEDEQKEIERCAEKIDELSTEEFTVLMRKIYSQGNFKALSEYEHTSTTLDLSNTSIVSMIAYAVTDEEKSMALIVAAERLYPFDNEPVL